MPARVLIARHAEATYRHPELVSDEGGWLTAKGVRQANDLGSALGPERPVAVFTSTTHRAAQTGAAAGAVLGLVPRVVDGIHEFESGVFTGAPDSDPAPHDIFQAWLAGDLDRRVPGALTGREIITRFRAAIDGIAVAHPDSTVLVISHGGVMSMAIPRLCQNIPDAVAQQHFLPNCAIARVTVDCSTWRLVGEWPGKEWHSS